MVKMCIVIQLYFTLLSHISDVIFAIQCVESEEITARNIAAQYKSMPRMDVFSQYTFKIIPPNATVTESTIVNTTDSNTLLSGRKSCNRDYFLTTRHAQINSQSVCPWFFEMNFDNNRHPTTIARARCTCTDCIATMGNCQEVYAYIPVVRRSCDYNTGTFNYFKYAEKVPVGCTCVRSHRIRRVGSSRTRRH